MAFWKKPIDAADVEAAHAWLGAARRPEVVAAIDELHAGLAERIVRRGPACWASGRCCNFAATGHLLFTTGLEAAVAWSRVDGVHARDAAADAKAVDDAAQGRRVALTVVSGAMDRDECPFLEGHLCGIHQARPMGCRVYFCDRSATQWQHELAEWGQEQVRALHDRLAIDYRYTEWRWLLTLFAHASRGG
jgi:Fe-S-cluster containining protein